MVLLSIFPVTNHLQTHCYQCVYLAVSVTLKTSFICSFKKYFPRGFLSASSCCLWLETPSLSPSCLCSFVFFFLSYWICLDFLNNVEHISHTRTPLTCPGFRLCIKYVIEYRFLYRCLFLFILIYLDFLKIMNRCWILLMFFLCLL